MARRRVRESIEDINERLKTVESRLGNTGYAMKTIVQSEIAKGFKLLPQMETAFGMHTAMCVDTIDPWKQNRVRFFNPLFHNKDTPIKGLPFASAISSMGGFDDSGLNWVPPAGSTLCMIYEHGNRQAPFYIGTTWHRFRGKEEELNFGYTIQEFLDIHNGHRKGYLVGSNEGDQVFPPWNTESYNGNDLDSITDFDDDPEAQQKITYPNIYGFKTPQKHALKMVDGNYKCNHRWKRLELFSSCGNYMIFKDDHIHNSGQWANNAENDEFKCKANEGFAVDICNDEDGVPLEDMDCEGEMSNSTIIDGHPSVGDNNGEMYEEIEYDLTTNKGYNPFYKHANECRPVQGPGTPQNNKLMLPQTGIQFISISGHTFGMDDSVEEPSGVPEWERSTQDFDFGCNDKYLGKTFWVSATGHSIVMSDVENEESGLRGIDNYIRLKTATGNKIELNDHTVGQEDCPGCPPNTGGEKRGITMQTTSNHVIEMIDNLNEQCGECRKEGAQPNNKAKKAYIKIRTGYGLEMAFNDHDRENDEEGSQQETKNQYIQIFSPQTDNKERGPHIMRFQENPSGPGQVYLKVGGDYVCQTYDAHVTVVGDVENNRADKIVNVSQNNIIQTEEIHFHKAGIHLLQADEVALIVAGLDCKPPEDPDAGEDSEEPPCAPCAWPVLCLTPKGITISDRVFVSASPDSQCAHIASLLPFHECDGSSIEAC